MDFMHISGQKEATCRTPFSVGMTHFESSSASCAQPKKYRNISRPLRGHEAYFTSGPNAAASIAPTLKSLIRNCANPFDPCRH